LPPLVVNLEEHPGLEARFGRDEDTRPFGIEVKSRGAELGAIGVAARPFGMSMEKIAGRT
jgi:hypothetical protein